MEKTIEKKKFNALFWIPVIYNSFCVFISLVVGIAFFNARRLPAGAPEPELSEFVLGCFAFFDFIMLISPVMLFLLAIVCIFNLIRETTNFRRFFPLIFSTITQGLLSALFLTTITRPIE